jgi:glutamate synthase (NADPH/NADH) large chain
VRNSGAVCVVEGTGDHGCEYMTGGVVVVLGHTGRNFAAGMSGGVAYVFDEAGDFEKRCNLAMVKLEKIAGPETGEHADMPRQRAVSVADAGMGDLLRFDAERLRVLVERHLLHTGSARAKALLDNWSATLGKFVKVMPSDYAKALADMKARAASIAAE